MNFRADATPHDPPAHPRSANSVPMTQSQNADALRLTIVYDNRAVTLTVSNEPIVADLLPDVVRRLGVLDPSIAYGGYRLITADGEPLSPSQTFREQHVPDQSVLTLEPGASTDTDIVYDDVVEAVGMSVQQVYRPWTKDHTTLTSLLISVGMLAISAGWLALFPASIWNASLGMGFCIVLIALSSLLHGRTMTLQATVIGLTASVFAAVGGYQLASYLVPDQAFHALPLVGASVGLLVSGCLMDVTAPSTRPYGLIPIIIGLLAAIPGTLSALLPSWMANIWIISTMFAALAANALPWICLSFARISVQSPHSDAEIFTLPERVDYTEVRRRYIAGSTMLFIGRVSVASMLLIAMPLLNSLSTPLGSMICLAAFLGMLLDSRQIHTLREMCVTVGAAGLGIICTGLMCVHAHPEFSIPLTVLMLCCALATIVLTHVMSRRPLFATRMADAAETLCIMLLPPLAYLAITL